jgi:hypothetical protein
MDGRPTPRMGYPPGQHYTHSPAIPNTPALVRARPTMKRPPWVLENDASADAVAQFNRAWLTFDDLIDRRRNKFDSRHRLQLRLPCFAIHRPHDWFYRQQVQISAY